MNYTKWREMFRTFFNLEYEVPEMLIRYKIKLREDENITKWDPSWTHLGTNAEYYRMIEWLKIELTEQNKERVLRELSKIHVPAEIIEDEVIIYGYRTDVDYLVYP